jgi:hypothetical protein
VRRHHGLIVPIESGLSNVMESRSDLYAYTLAQCDIPLERRSALESYRAKRRLWLSWISSDEHHAIWTVLCDMVWTDASFKALTSFATGDESNGLNNSLLAEALFHGHVATQVLAIRRLMDDGNSDIISLRRLVKDLKRSWALFTREITFALTACPTTTRRCSARTCRSESGRDFPGAKRPGRERTPPRTWRMSNSTSSRASIRRGEAVKIAYRPLS